MAELPGVTARSSRYGDGVSFFAGDREVAHFHGDSRMDVRLTRGVIRVMKAAGPVDPRLRTRGATADWAEVHFRELRDLSFALDLVEQAVRANA